MPFVGCRLLREFAWAGSGDSSMLFSFHAFEVRSPALQW